MKYALRCVPLLLLALLAFAPHFQAAGSASLTRGPYLQAAGQNTLTLVWNLDVSAPCVLRWGTLRGPNWENVQDLAAAKVHTLTLDALRPDTRYFYEIEADGLVVATGADCYFDTYPPINSRKPFTFLAWGDSGSGDANQAAVAAQMNALSPRPAFGLGIGDLIYPAGEAANYNPRFFTPYAPMLRNMVVWPAMGNHDAMTKNGKPYLDAFVLPTGSGTELYYSFDYGNAHFTCLDSQVTYFAGTTARNVMLAWLAADLDDANSRGARWKIVFFHHPPYSKGTHDSDTDAQLTWMRNNLNPVMEARGVDFVLTGHSHVYERSYLLKNDAILQGSLNDYSKIATPDGSIYMVAGCGGEVGTGALNHPLMAYAQGNIAGNAVIDVSFDECRGYFVQSTGARLDLFNLRKAIDAAPPALTGADALSTASVRVTFSEPVQAGTGANGAENLSNYAVSGGATISAAALQSDARTVLLSTSALATNTAFTLTVNNVRDRAAAPNTIVANSRLTFALAAPGANLPPLAQLEVDLDTLNAPGTANFTGAASSDPDGTIATWLWDFGDGATANTASVTHTFAAGMYPVALTVTDNGGAQAVARHWVRVHTQGQAPTAVISASALNILPGQDVTFGSTGSSDPDGGSVFLFWRFDDPISGANVSTASAPTHHFITAGTYEVRLDVTDDEGSMANATVTINVSGPAAPVITTSALPTGQTGKSYAQTLAGTSGTAPYVWTLDAGALPNGVTLSAAGSLSGKPSQSGTFIFTARMTDANGAYALREFSLKVNGDEDESGCSTSERQGLLMLVMIGLVLIPLCRRVLSARVGVFIVS
jgi:PKD repeat protein